MLTRKELDETIRPIDFAPQKGMQEDVATSNTSMVIYGGNRGGGKSLILTMCATENIGHPAYKGLIFRKKI